MSTPDLIALPDPSTPPDPPPDHDPPDHDVPDPDVAREPGVADTAWGVTNTPRGVRFAQPPGVGRSIYVAGDFNAWSSTATPLRYDEIKGAHEALVEIPPGRYRYRLIVDGRWLADPHNDNRQLNDYNETNNVLVVPGTGEQP